MASAAVNLGVYSVLVLAYTYAVYYDFLVVHVPMSPRNGFAKIQYLTVFNLIFDFLYVWLCFVRAVYDFVIPSPKKQPSSTRSKINSSSRGATGKKIRCLIDNLYGTFFVPLGLMVALLFWGLYFQDPEFVLPKVVRPYYPDWLNHFAHTGPLVFILIDTVLHRHVYPKQGGWLPIVALCFIYQVNLVVTRYFAGFWLYPFFAMVSTKEAAMFFVFTYFFGLAGYFVGVVINRMYWGPQNDAQPYLATVEQNPTFQGDVTAARKRLQ